MRKSRIFSAPPLPTGTHKQTPKKTVYARTITLIDFACQAMRFCLGPSKVCIYRISCPEYARAALAQHHFIKAIALICLRVLSCNPLVGIYLGYQWNKKVKKESGSLR